MQSPPHAPIAPGRPVQGKKGVSADEKKQRMLSMFHSSRAVYAMKDVEREAPKLGIISNAVKDVLKELICDDLVLEDKVGVSTYYWSFPGQAGSKKRAELANLRQQTAVLRAQVGQLKAQQAEQAKQRAQETGGRDESADIASVSCAIEALKQDEARLDGQLKAADMAGVLDLRQRIRDVPALKEAANRWTDNVFEVRKKFIDLFQMEPKAVDKEFGIDGLDYLE
eukprot:scaffold7079_cov128-Isochrysis_galbana.AAC.1